MTCVLLAAGYATRLYPLTLDTPLALLEVGGKTILARLLENVWRTDCVGETILVTNSRFRDRFEACMPGHASPGPGRSPERRFSILDDGTVDVGDRLGAVGDLAFAIRSRGLDDDLLVLAADNLLGFELADFVEFHRSRGTDCATVERIEDEAALRRTGVAVIAPDGRILSFREKPARPASNDAVPPFYIYRRDTLALVDEYLHSGGNPDAPGHFLEWLCTRRPVFAYRFSGGRTDIGTLDTYRAACTAFAGRRGDPAPPV